MPADLETVTLIRERRRDGDVFAAVCAVGFGLAAWRGAAAAPVLAVLMGLLAIGTVAAWAAWRRAPRMELTITASDVTLGRPGRVVSHIPRSGEPLELNHKAVRQPGWFLVPRRDSGMPGISLIGFDPVAVRRACVDHGWQIRGGTAET